MIQDIAPHTYHNEYKPVAPDKESHILAYEEGKILMKKDGETMTCLLYTSPSPRD